MDEDRERDEALMSELRAFFADTDPVPPVVTEAANAALGWRRLDADLAELLRDSAVEQESLALARSGEVSTRSLTFAAAQLTIDVEIREDDGTRTLLGQLSPAASATIEIQTVDEPLVSVTTDQLGRFRVILPTGGPVRLRVVDPNRPPGRAVETSWIRI
jgi:hypothetical protein